MEAAEEARPEVHGHAPDSSGGDVNDIAFLISTAGVSCILPYAVAIKKAKTTREQAKAAGFWIGCAFTCYTVAGFLTQFPGTYFTGALAALCWWVWWHSGGGDDTKKRRKALARKFTPRRRTAPVLT